VKDYRRLKQLLPPEQVDQEDESLGALGNLAVEAVQHWRQYRPKMYKEYLSQGRDNLLLEAWKEAQRTQGMYQTLRSQGVQPLQAADDAKREVLLNLGW
jgi:hypothetical protein